MSCYSSGDDYNYVEESQLNQGHSIEEDIEGDYVICVDGRNIKENENMRYRDSLEPVFLIAHKSDLNDWMEVEVAEFKNGKMVHNPTFPLIGKYGKDVVAWVEVTGPIKIRQHYGDTMTFVLNPESALDLCPENTYTVIDTETTNNVSPIQEVKVLEIY